MGNCKDCHYWDKESFLCDEVGKMYDVEPYSMKFPGNTDFKLAVVCLDDSGLEVGLKVGPLFGCVKYKYKEEEKEDESQE